MKILFYIAKLYSIPVVDPLIKVCKSKTIDYAFYTSEKVKSSFPDEWDSNKNLDSLEEAKKFNSDFVLSPGNFVDFRLPGLKVQLFHGLGVEKESHYKIRHFFDIYFTCGPFVTKRFNRMQKKYGYFLVKETGWPKIDYIMNYKEKNLKKKFDLPEDKNIILYAPTFSIKMESATELLPVLGSYIKENEFLLIKFHELMNKELVEKIKSSENKNIKLIDTYDITPFLHISDVLISDTSSVIYEFLTLQKPVITYKTKSREDKGINITSADKLRKALDRAFSENFEDQIKKHINDVNPYIDGKSSERIIQFLEEVNKNRGILPRISKPLNLFRKMQIIYHSWFRKGYLR